MESPSGGRKRLFNYAGIAAICFVSILGIAVSLQILAFSTNAVATKSGTSIAQTSGGSLYGQSYSGVMMGSELYENNSFPFANYASTSQILALPAISSWLAENNYSVYDLRPYLSMYPSGGNPYDFSQGGAVVNGTTYYIYEYLVANSSVGLVIGAHVTSNSTVAEIFTYDTCPGPNSVFVNGGGGNIVSSKTNTSSTTCATDVP